MTFFLLLLIVLIVVEVVRAVAVEQRVAFETVMRELNCANGCPPCVLHERAD